MAGNVTFQKWDPSADALEGGEGPTEAGTAASAAAAEAKIKKRHLKICQTTQPRPHVVLVPLVVASLRPVLAEKLRDKLTTSHARMAKREQMLTKYRFIVKTSLGMNCDVESPVSCAHAVQV
eukprot:16935-Pelagomonas_calceolata.AAC.1